MHFVAFAYIPEISDGSATYAWPVHPALVGRDEELAALAGLVWGAARGHGDVAAVIGAPGMGKSRLLTAIGESAEQAGVTALAFETVEAAQQAPLAMARSLAGALGVALDDGPDAVGTGALRLAAEKPFVLLVDDAQWIDAASVPYVIALVHAAVTGALGVVVASRPPTTTSTPLRRVLGSIERRDGRIVHLGSLSDDDARELAQSVSGVELGDDERSVLAAAAGNPFLVIEVASAIRADRKPGAESVLTHTLHHLSPEARTLLDHASVLGRNAAVVDLAHMAQCSPAALAEAVREAVGSGVIDASGDLLVFRHDLIREAVYGLLPTAVRGAIHREAATALAARAADPSVVAAHLLEGALPGDETAIQALETASAQASAADLGVATALLEGARRLCADGSDRADAIDRRLVILLAWTGRSDEAILLSRRLISRSADPNDEARLRARLAEALARGGDEVAASLEAEQALRLPELSPSRRAILLVLRATGLWDSEPERARAFLAEARSLAADDTQLEFAAIEHEAVSYSAECSVGQYRDVAARGVELARAEVGRRRPLAEAHMSWALANAGEALIATEKYDAALRTLASAEHHARRAGLMVSVCDLAGVRAEAHIMWCRWDDALAEVAAREELLLELGTDDSSSSGVPVRAASLRARIALLTAPASAGDLLDRWQPMASSEIERARLRWWRGLCAHLGGDAAGANEHYEHAVASTREFAARGKCAIRMLGWQMSWATPFLQLWVAGRLDDARFLADLCLPVSQRNATLARWASGAACAEAVLTGSRSLTQSALSAAHQVASPLFRYMALRDVADAAALVGAKSVAGEALDSAARLSTEVGTPPPAGTPPPRRARPLTGWESLTATEQRVSALVAEGRSNVEIASQLMISRYTVETHLKHVFQKLAISSRVELATLVVRRQNAV